MNPNTIININIIIYITTPQMTIKSLNYAVGNSNLVLRSSIL